MLSRTLAANGIKTRHYAVDDTGTTLMLNEELAAEAARRALADRGLGPQQVRMLADLGNSGVPAQLRRPPHGGGLDFSMLEVPEIDPEPGTRRLLNLDIQTALCLMNIPFAFCLTPGEYRRAVHSPRLDASLRSVLAALTGDHTFLGWRTALPPVRVDSNMDVPATVYEHALICEYALARLGQIRDAAAYDEARPERRGRIESAV